VWLTPTQAVIIPISEAFSAYAHQVAKAFGFLRLHMDDRNEKLNYKLRDHLSKKVPYVLIAGEKEQSSNTIVVRHKNEQHTMTLEDAVTFLSHAACLPELGNIS
jgi:threonyl-tRNA synthetase